MQRSGIWKYMPAALLAAALVAGPVVLSAGPALAADQAAAATENVYKGKVVGKSNKAKTISIELDGGKVEMVKFDDNTTGLDHAKTGEGAIVQFELRGDDRVATVVKPKLVPLPPGVTEMQPDELAALIELGPEKGNYFLIDSRPGGRYAEAHIPTAVSIPVPKLKKTGTAHLPGDAKIKNTMLVFYCGGPT